jgi:drug/metabolite transporter (DMT)-like permease
VTIAWCSLTWAALTAFILVVHTGPAQAARLPTAGWCLGAALVVVVALVVAARRARTNERRGLLYGAGAGVLFGLVAGLAKVALGQLTAHWWSVLEHWSLWALVVVGLGAILLNQRAFQATRLSVTMPMVNIVNVLVAIGFGAAVFGERLFATPLTLVVEVLALVAMGIGVRQLAAADPDEGSSQSSRSSVDASTNA